MFLVQLLFALGLAANAALAGRVVPLPTVDLGYEVHQAISFNSTGAYYNFSNIRYAQPPVGNLRFAAPVPPKGNSTQVNKGEIGTVCPQAYPGWVVLAENFTNSLLLGIPFNYSAAYSDYQFIEKNIKLFAAAASDDPRTSEDCLFLDVMVPKKIFDNKGKGKGAAVLVWIYGGGYTGGSKEGYGDPAGLIHASQSSGSDGVIYVSLNYRLGALGWSVGPTFQGDGGVPNAGLYDQRLALEWIQSNIYLFGGDPDRVTIFGESAGGGSIMHQITAYAGLKPVPFQQAIPQSPGWLPTVSASLQENTWNAFLKLCNVSSLAEARKLPSETVITANSFQIASTPNYGSFPYGPAVDGYFVPELPGRLLLEGHFAKNLKIMTGHNADEGPLFSNPGTITSTEYNSYLETSYPGISQAALDYIQNVLYPSKLNGSYGYTSQLQREILLVSESIFTCNTNYLARAYGNKTYSYQFSVPPAIHGEDLPFTYYDGNVTSVFDRPNIAIALQQFITSFAETGVPSAKGAPTFPTYGSNAQVLNINVTGLSVIKDSNANERCYWWQKGLFN